MRSSALAVVFTLALIACKKKPDPATLAAASAPAAAAPAAAPGATSGSFAGFEGKIGLAVKGKLGAGQPKPLSLDLNVQVKGDKLRADLPPGALPLPDAGPVYLIIEAEAKKVYAVMEAKKQALLVDLDKLAPQLEAMAKSVTGGAGGAGSAGPKPMPTGKKTDRRDKVAGHACEIWEVTHEGKRMELCVLADDKGWLKLPESALPPQLAWARELVDGRHLPLRYVAYETDGKESGRVEVTSVERTALPAAAFEVPKGFVIVSFDQMAGLGGLLGGGPGGLPAIKGLPPDFKLPPGVVLPPGLPGAPAPKSTGAPKP